MSPNQSQLRLHTRRPISAYVEYNTYSKSWITILNTNQSGAGQEDKKSNNNNKNDRGLHVLSFPTEHDAKEAACNFAPPQLVSAELQRNCYLCEKDFSMLRKAENCKNCGACICNNCSVNWTKEMLPWTFTATTKNANKNSVKVCKTCDYIATSFRKVLLTGDYETALKLYMTGNINLRCPFTNVKKGDEIMHPIHCAAISGNVKLLHWLIDIHKCPFEGIEYIDRKQLVASKKLIKTSHGRNIMDLAIVSHNVDVLHYLVNHKKISILEAKNDETNNHLLSTLEAVLNVIPDRVSSSYEIDDRPSLKQMSVSMTDSESFHDEDDDLVHAITGERLRVVFSKS